MELKNNEDYQKVESLKAEEMRLGKALVKNDHDIFSEQLKLFN